MGAAQHDGHVRDDGPAGLGVGQGRRRQFVVRGGHRGNVAARFKECAQGREVRWRQEEIDERETGAEAVEFAGIFPDEATHERDGPVRMFPLELGHVGQARIDLVLGLLAHDAGVQQKQGGVAGVFHGPEAGGFQQRGRAQGVGLVHLAADGPEMVGGRRQERRAGATGP